MVLSLKLLFAGAYFLKGSCPGVAPMMYVWRVRSVAQNGERHGGVRQHATATFAPGKEQPSLFSPPTDSVGGINIGRLFWSPPLLS